MGSEMCIRDRFENRRKLILNCLRAHATTYTKQALNNEIWIVGLKFEQSRLSVKQNYTYMRRKAKLFAGTTWMISCIWSSSGSSVFVSFLSHLHSL